MSEDKQMGNFFITNSIDERQFIDKVMFYLWNDICKDEYGANSFFRRYIDENNPDDKFQFVTAKSGLSVKDNPLWNIQEAAVMAAFSRTYAPAFSIIACISS